MPEPGGIPTQRLGRCLSIKNSIQLYAEKTIIQGLNVFLADNRQMPKD